MNVCDEQLASRGSALHAAGGSRSRLGVLIPTRPPTHSHPPHTHAPARRRAAGAPKTGAAKYSRGESINTKRITDVKLKAKVKYSERCVRLRLCCVHLSIASFYCSAR